VSYDDKSGTYRPQINWTTVTSSACGSFNRVLFDDQTLVVLKVK